MKKDINLSSRAAKERYLKSLMNSRKQQAVQYEKHRNHNVGDYIDHFHFGLGFIQKVVSSTKIEVFFEDSERVLLQNWE